MKDLVGLQPEEQVLVLMDMLEEQQTELEEKDKIINSQQTQLNDSLKLVEKLNSENRQENVQVLKNDLKQTKQLLQEETEKVSEANKSIEDMQDKLVQTEQGKREAIEHQRIVEVPVEKPVLYEKCKSCDQRTFRKARSRYERQYQTVSGKYKKKEAALDGMLIGFLLYSILITVFMAIRSEIFQADVVVFFKTLLEGTKIIASAILLLGQKAASISSHITNVIAAVIVHWVLLIVVIGICTAGIIALLWLVVVKVKRLYRECCYDKISLMVIVISLALLLFFGDWIRQLFHINLLLLLLLEQIIYVFVRWYVKGCRRSRGWIR